MLGSGRAQLAWPMSSPECHGDKNFGPSDLCVGDACTSSLPCCEVKDNYQLQSFISTSFLYLHSLILTNSPQFVSLGHWPINDGSYNNNNTCSHWISAWHEIRHLWSTIHHGSLGWTVQIAKHITWMAQRGSVQIYSNICVVHYKHYMYMKTQSLNEMKPF